jgi:hypothetical protein
MLKRILISIAVAFAAAAPMAHAGPVGTAFTFQGFLQKNSLQYQGPADFEFRLFDAASGGNPVGSTLTRLAEPVTQGLFTVSLDFGAVFDGNGRWLEVSVKTAGDPSFTTLTTRVAVQPTPYALNAPGSGGFSLPFLASAPAAGQVNNNDPLQGTALFNVENTAVSGVSHGVVGMTRSEWQNATGVLGVGEGTSGYTSGVQGHAVASPLGTGVVGIGTGNGAYFRGEGPGGDGVEAASASGAGVNAYSTSGTGVRGTSDGDYGIYGRSDAAGKSGLFGQTYGGTNAGVLGRNEANTGEGQGVFGYAAGNAVGVLAVSEGNDGLSARTNAANKSAVFGYTAVASSYGGFFVNAAPGGVALRSDGLAQVRTLQILGGADLAERFPVREPVEPGMVLVIDPAVPGRLMVSSEPFARSVAGVVSGANELSAGIELSDGEDLSGTAPVALSGRVWVRAEALERPIRPGDLLTTSVRPGHARAAGDDPRAHGAVLGKAMSALEAGTGMVLVLVSLR